MEAVLPIEVEIPSLRIFMEEELEEGEWLKARYEHLNLIEEKRLRAICHAQAYQRRMARAYYNKVKPREFQPGDLVLKKILPHQRDQRGKFSLNYSGPFIVKKVLPGGALILGQMDDEDLPEPVNADPVKKYFV